MQMRYARARGPTRRTDGWTRRDQGSLPLYFNSLVAIFSLVPSLSVFLPRQPEATLRSFSTGKIRYVLPFSLSLSIISTPLRFLCQSFSSPPLPVVDNSTSHLVLLSRSSIPRLFSPLLFFSIFRISLFYFRLHFSTVPLFLPFLVLSLLSRSAHPARLAQYLSSSPPFFPLCRPIVCGALLPAYSYARFSL